LPRRHSRDAFGAVTEPAELDAHVGTRPGPPAGRAVDDAEPTVDGDIADQLICDHALFHLEADLRWLELTSARLGALAEKVTA
jgi:hypothetical protein